MKKTGKLLFSFGLLLGFLSIFSLSNKKTVAVSAATQTHRRVYAYLMGDWTDDVMYIHYWGGASGTDWNNSPQMTQVVNDYWTGLFYYDIPVDATTLLVKKISGAPSINSDQSEDINVSSLFTANNFYAAGVGGWVNDGAKRVVTFADTLGGNSGQVANVLAHTDSCSDSFASGYNAWPQLDDLFITPSTLDGSTVVNDLFGRATTISDKVAMLQSQYTANGGSSRGFYSEAESNTTAMLAIGGIGVATIGGYALLKKKRFI